MFGLARRNSCATFDAFRVDFIKTREIGKQDIVKFSITISRAVVSVDKTGADRLD